MVSSPHLFWSISFFLYFSLKDFVLSKLFKKLEKPIPWYISLVYGLCSIWVSSLLIAEYDKISGMGYIKGATYLPPFPLLFILADLIGNVIFLLMMVYQTGTRLFKIPFMRIAYNFFSLFLIYVMFSMIASQFVYSKDNVQEYISYECFGEQMALDIAIYYFDNGKLPNKLEDFTDTPVNPYNNSPLIYTHNGNSSHTVYVKDEEGNELVKGYEALMGLSSYKDRPKDYFRTRTIGIDNFCPGTARIPEKYKPEPLNFQTK